MSQINLIFFLQYCILSSTIIHCRSVLLSFELTWWSLHYYNLAVIIKPLGSPVNVMIPGVEPEGLVGPGFSSWFKHTRGFTVNSAGLYLQCWNLLISLLSLIILKWIIWFCFIFKDFPDFFSFPNYCLNFRRVFIFSKNHSTLPPPSYLCFSSGFIR